MGKLRANFGYQTVYQLLITILPLITAPYLARVLGAYQLGICSYTSSVVGYFTLFALLGTINYGTRAIASCGNDISYRSRTFWSIYLLQVFLSVICILLYTIYTIFVCKENQLIVAIQGISIFACLIDINWLFFGMELFRTTVTRSSIIKVLSALLIVLCVKSENDTWIYVLILVGSTCASYLVLWFFAFKYIRFVKVSLREIVDHIKPNFVLFIPLLAMSVYHIMDKTMLGMLSDYNQSGFYYNSDKIVNIMVGIISGFSTVMLPRMTSLINEGKIAESDKLFKTSLECTVLVGISISCGIASIAHEFIPFFFGDGYEECVMLTILLAPVLIIKSFSFTARYQYLIPHRREKDYIISVFLGAITNVGANYLLIPQLGALGAVIGTLVAESAACLWQFISIRKTICLKSTIIRCAIYCFFGGIMFICVRILSCLNVAIYYKIVLEISIGAFVFIILCLLYWKVTGNKLGNVMKQIVIRKK